MDATAALLEHYVCDTCGCAWERPRRPGPKPRACPKCIPKTTHYYVPREPRRIPCAECRTEFVARGALSKYCSAVCRSAARSVRTARPKATGTCEHCGVTFTGRAGRRYCGPRCVNLACEQRAGRQRNWRRNEEVAARRRSCVVCGTALRYSLRDDPCCRDCVGRLAHREAVRSAAIRKLEHAQHLPSLAVAWVAGPCWMCGALFVDRHRRSTRQTCSPVCARRAKRIHRTAVKQARRLRVLTRDRWVCQICKRPIDQSATAPHPLSATVDHIVPRADGGSNKVENLRAAHFRCNSSRGRRGGWEQLALIG